MTHHGPPRIRLPLVAVLLALLAAVPMTLFSVLTLLIVMERQREAENVALTHRAEAVAGTLDRHLAARASLLAAIAHGDAARQGDIQGLYAHAARLAPYEAGLEAIALIDRTGAILFSTQYPYGETLPDSHDSAGVRRIIETGQAMVSGPFVGALSPQPLVALGVPVFVAGRPRYALRAMTPVSELKALLEQQRLPRDWFVSVMAGETVIASRDAAGEDGAPGRVEAVTADEGGADPDDAAAFPPLVLTRAAVGDWGWTVVVAVPEEAFVRPLRQMLGRFGVGGLLCLLFGLAASLWLAGGSIATSTPWPWPRPPWPPANARTTRASSSGKWARSGPACWRPGTARSRRSPIPSPACRPGPGSRNWPKSWRAGRETTPGSAWRSFLSISTASSGSTTSTATNRATGCWPKRPGCCAATSAKRTWPAGSAGTNSWSAWSRPSGRCARRPRPWPAASFPASPPSASAGVQPRRFGLPHLHPQPQARPGTGRRGHVRGQAPGQEPLRLHEDTTREGRPRTCPGASVPRVPPGAFRRRCGRGRPRPGPRGPGRRRGRRGGQRGCRVSVGRPCGGWGGISPGVRAAARSGPAGRPWRRREVVFFIQEILAVAVEGEHALAPAGLHDASSWLRRLSRMRFFTELLVRKMAMTGARKPTRADLHALHHHRPQARGDLRRAKSWDPSPKALHSRRIASSGVPAWSVAMTRWPASAALMVRAHGFPGRAAPPP